MKSEKIFQAATRFRTALELCEKSKMPITFQDFPAGSCGDSALLLAAYLVDLKLGEFQYVLGSRGDARINTWHSHAWLEGCGLTIDITADQFSDCQSKVYVGASSNFHLTFEIEEKFVADFRVYDRHTVQQLASAYSYVKKLITSA